AVAANGVPSAVVEVKVGINDDVHIFRGNASRSEVFQQLRRLAEDLHHLLRKLVAGAGLDQDVLLSGADQDRVQTGADKIVLVGRELPRPKTLGHHSKERAAVEVVVAVGEGCEFEVADGDAVHGLAPSRRLGSRLQSRTTPVELPKAAESRGCKPTC